MTGIEQVIHSCAHSSRLALWMGYAIARIPVRISLMNTCKDSSPNSSEGNAKGSFVRVVPPAVPYSVFRSAEGRVFSISFSIQCLLSFSQRVDVALDVQLWGRLHR